MIIKALNNTNIKRLDISDNFLKADSIKELITLLHNKDLQTLKISDCSIGKELTELIFEFGKNKDEILIEEFAYNYNEITDKESLVIFLQKFPKLKKLSIKYIIEEEEE